MAQGIIKSCLRPLVRSFIEYQPSRNVMHVPPNMTALYVLYSSVSESRNMNVRYVGYAHNKNGDDARSLLQERYRDNSTIWTHFSVYELWDHFQKDDTQAVDALFDHVYRHDAHLKTHLARNKRIETRDNDYIPKELFVSFINSVARASTTIVDPRIANKRANAWMFEN